MRDNTYTVEVYNTRLECIHRYKLNEEYQAVAQINPYVDGLLSALKLVDLPARIRVVSDSGRVVVDNTNSFTWFYKWTKHEDGSQDYALPDIPVRKE